VSRNSAADGASGARARRGWRTCCKGRRRRCLPTSISGTAQPHPPLSASAHPTSCIIKGGTQAGRSSRRRETQWVRALKIHSTAPVEPHSAIQLDAIGAETDPWSRHERRDCVPLRPPCDPSGPGTSGARDVRLTRRDRPGATGPGTRSGEGRPGPRGSGPERRGALAERRRAGSRAGPRAGPRRPRSAQAGQCREQSRWVGQGC
jgi:hypothetical protein